MGVWGKGMAFGSPWPHISTVESLHGISCAANSSGDRYLSGLCGLSLLYPFLQASIFALASARVRNQFAFRHSSRNRPLKLSMWPFCIGRPGSMNTRRICRSSHQLKQWRDVNSGPLSQRMASGLPRWARSLGPALSSRAVIQGSYRSRWSGTRA